MSTTDLPRPNLALLDKVLDIVKAERRKRKEGGRSRWYQAAWITGDDDDYDDLIPVVDETGDTPHVPVSCGTSFCFAGWVVQATGGVFLSDQHVLADPDLDQPVQVYDVTFDVVDKSDDTITTTVLPATMIEYRARNLLGLTYSEARELFEGHNTYGDVKRAVRRIRERAAAMEVAQ